MTDIDLLLSPGEVARLLGVCAKTVTRWDTVGKLKSVRTLGGHRRFLRTDIYELINARNEVAIEETVSE